MKSNKSIKRILSGLLALTMLIGMLCAFPQSAIAAPGEYNPGDIAVINAIIDNNGWDVPKADPADGSYVPEEWGHDNTVIWSNNVTDKHIVTLNLIDKLLIGELDLSGLINMKELNCRANNLTTLNLSGLSNLKTLYCSINNLVELDLSGLTKLTRIDCSYNGLDAIDISGLANLEILDCNANNLAELDVSQCLALQRLGCSNNKLTALDVSQNPALYALECDNNEIAELDVSQNLAIETLRCSGNKLAELNVSGHSRLYLLICDRNRIRSLAFCLETWSYTYLDVRNNYFTNKNQISGIDPSVWDTGNEYLDGGWETLYLYSPQKEPEKRGDANCDSKITAADAAAILRHLVRLKALSDSGFLNARVMNNVDVSAADAAKILRYLVRLEAEL